MYVRLHDVIHEHLACEVIYQGDFDERRIPRLGGTHLTIQSDSFPDVLLSAQATVAYNRCIVQLMMTEKLDDRLIARIVKFGAATGFGGTVLIATSPVLLRSQVTTPNRKQKIPDWHTLYSTRPGWNLHFNLGAGAAFSEFPFNVRLGV